MQLNLPAKISAEVLPKARKVTPAIFWDRPNVLDIIKSAGQRKSVAVTPVATNSVSSHKTAIKRASGIFSGLKAQKKKAT